MTLFDAELKRIVERCFARSTCKSSVPGFILRRIEHCPTHTSLEDDGVDMYLLVVVEDATEVCLLPFRRG
jgi:hypothetical protein